MQDHPERPGISKIRCEGCGYVLDGLSGDGVCSECGLDIALSLPRTRAGTLWQQRAGIRSLIRTWWLLLWDDECWREIRIDHASRRSFVGCARVLAYSALLLVSIWQVFLETGGKVHGGAFTYLVFLMIVPMLVMEIAMRLYREFLKWRLMLGSKFRDESQEQAMHEQVLDHACVGMMIVPIFFALGLLCINIGIMIDGATSSSVALAVGFYSGAGLALLGFVIGVMFFELSYRRGWRVMRYRCVTYGESRQINDDDHECTDEVFDFLSELILKYVVVPVVFFVSWLVYGLPVATAIFLAVLAFGVLSIFQRMLMVPVRLMSRRNRRGDQ